MSTSVLPDVLQIGRLSVSPPVVLAPMAGVTTAPYRTLCRRFGNRQPFDDATLPPGDASTASGGLYVNQMITARALMEGHKKMLHTARFADGEAPRSIQLYGTDPYWIGEAVRKLVGEGEVDHIDLNLGCPVPKVTRHGGGSALPWHHHLLRNIVRAMVNNAEGVPITLKFRIGIDDDHITHLDTGRIAEDEGASAVALHARTAEQAYSGTARWEAIGELKEHVTSIPVLGNGDIWEASDAQRMMAETGCDGVVVGRGCLGRPWLFQELSEAFTGTEITPAPSLAEVGQIMTTHLDLLIDWLGEDRGTRDFRKHPGWYLKGFPVGSQVRQQLNQMKSRDEMLAVLGSLADEPFPPEAARLTRGHSHGPRRVALPHRWIETRDDPTPPGAAAAAYTSGG
ncbi:MAG: tRNA dihydrouridine synthase DusB [Acidimicrobiales bacterium]|nr:MAG: tRNA dihydrouridine synthase DusB [Acidimicrobiales bacterium]